MKRTGEVSCRSRSPRACAPSATGSAVTFETTGNAGSPKVTPSNAAPSPGSATAISGEWKAPLTGRGTTRFAPFFLASSPARRTASTSPEITTCPGAL